MKRLLLICIAASTMILAPISSGCPMKGQGQGKRMQHRNWKTAHGSHAHCRVDSSHDADMEVFHYLVDHRDVISRTVTVLDNGVETITESEDPEVREKIRTHVESMQARLVEGNPIHLRDPLFAEIFANADNIEIKIEQTDKGVRVLETSGDDHVAKLIQAHAEVIEKFIEIGRSEMRKNHEVPAR